ncbi:MAG TPA: conjugal transfer protein TrbL family protein [Candidatus Acidoferrales bacterium]|nr:conjugal transfer protein TrbL family protein [Candidatus Acidoferrales bacterium]
MDVLNQILGSLAAIRQAVDLGGALSHAVHGGVAPLSNLLSDFLATTANPVSGGPFIGIAPIARLEPLAELAADAGLSLVLLLVFAGLIWRPLAGGAHSPARILPRFLVAIILVNTGPTLVQSAVDASNVVSQVTWGAALSAQWGQVLPHLSYDPGQPYLSVLVGLGLFVGFVALGAALIIRFAVLGVLAILCPIAALLLVLPETQHYARLWSSLFVSTLLMQPVQLLILGIGFELDQGFASPIGHIFALAALWMTMKVPSLLRSGAFLRPQLGR